MTKVLRLSLLLCALFAAPAAAQSEARPDSRIVVTTADLDLASASGQRTLDRRLAQAVVEACGATSASDLAGTNAIGRCRDETSARIVADRNRLVELATSGKAIVLAAR